MARAAVLGRLTWRAATVTAVRAETDTVRTLVLDVPQWPGHLAGQHVDIRLTAPDGYSAQRSYSIASAAVDSTVDDSAVASSAVAGSATAGSAAASSTVASSTVELTVQRVPDGEVSSYLVDEARVGDQFELRGPVGGYFTWQSTNADPVLLVAGGSGIVPLMSMVRTRAALGSRVPFRLVYSVRSPDAAIYATELAGRVRDDHGLDVAYAYTRTAPPAWLGTVGRLDPARLGEASWPAEFAPLCFVCGPTTFVETVADLLVAAGHPPERVRTERFG